MIEHRHNFLGLVPGGDASEKLTCVDETKRILARWTDPFDHYAMRHRQLLVDISELVKLDKKTGIPRVVRSVLTELFAVDLDRYRIEPIYASLSHGYRYARRFTAQFLGLGDGPPHDDMVETMPGDIFWGLDWQPVVVPHHRAQFAAWRRSGVRVVFTVYDLLPLILPETTFAGVSRNHARWLEVVAEADGLLAISRTVMNDLADWLDLFGRPQSHTVRLGCAHLGANVVRTVEGQVSDTDRLLQCLQAVDRYPAFLMVGTIEPRKAHAQVLAAFELLWARGVRVTLVVVGKAGWKTDKLAAQLRNHPMAGIHLFWLEGISDPFLEQVYAACSCLIAASWNEGFGLPLVEAAMRRLPILARNIPVFHEVAGANAVYFEGRAPDDLADAVMSWLKLRDAGITPQSSGMNWFTWAQSTQAMLDVVLHEQWQSVWSPKPDHMLVARFWGSDDRLDGGAGERAGKEMISIGRSGHLISSPNFELTPSTYVVQSYGRIGAAGAGGAIAYICREAGKTILAATSLDPVRQEESGLLATLYFDVETACQDFEVRIMVSEQSDISINLIEIKLASGSHGEVFDLSGLNRFS